MVPHCVQAARTDKLTDANFNQSPISVLLADVLWFLLSYQKQKSVTPNNLIVCNHRDDYKD